MIWEFKIRGFRSRGSKMPSRAAAIAWALAVLWLAPAAAQVGGAPRPPAPPKAGTTAPPPVCQDLVRQRDEVARYGQAIQAASKKRANPAQLCKLLNAFTAAESRMLKTMEERRAACGVPPEVIAQVKEGHGKA